MRTTSLCLIVFTLASASAAHAQSKAAPKPGGPETRYFTTIEGLMDGNADVILRETRQGKTVTAATLDICYSADKASARKDRFVANLAVSGATLTGTAQTQIDKLPVSVKLTRKATSDTFEFKGQITVGQTTNDVASTDNSDMSEQEFQETQATDDGIAAAPKDFTEVSPEAIAVRLKLDAVTDFLKSLKGQNVEVSLTGLEAGCEVLRAGEQTVNVAVDPARAAAFVARAKTMPGVVAAGWTVGLVDMEHAIRFAAADWRDGDKLNRDKLAAAIAATIARTLSAKAVSSVWDDNTGQLKMTFKRPSKTLPALELTDTIAFPALISADQPGNSDRLMLWLGSPTITTADESPSGKLALAQNTAGDEEGEPQGDEGALDAVAKDFKAQRWDADKSAWK